MTYIRIKGLKVAYGAESALKEINVEIPDKQITVIIGPSGCGKTTLLKSINKLIELYENVKVEGEVLIEGEDIYSPRVDILALRKKVGFLPQRPCPLPTTIYGNVVFGPRVHKLTKDNMIKQIKDLKNRGLIDSLPGNGGDYSQLDNEVVENRLVECYLKLAGLWEEVKDRLHSPASKLSVGQQQRLSLARALAIEPRVILADEPTSALDPISAKLIEKQFQILKKYYTIVVVTHILRQAKRIADYVIFMYLGDLVEHAPAKKFFNSPREERTKAYLSGEIS